MPFEGVRGLVHKAAYWQCVGRDINAQAVLSANPIDLNVRWDDTHRQVADADGNLIAIDATAVVDRDIPIGSVMWKGSIQLMPGSAQMPDRDVFEVVMFNNVPDFRGRFTYREVNMIRKRDSV